MHTVYWAAYKGNQKIVQQALDKPHFDSFAHCYKKQTILMGAISGRQTEIADLVFDHLKLYETERIESYLCAQDSDGNTALHLAYAKYSPPIR